jgi:hypothetical protein
MRGQAAFVVVIVAACGSVSYRFPARRFDPARVCVETISTIATIDGTDPGAKCDPVCLIGPATADGELPIYVTTECPPYPRTFDSSGTAPDCARAIGVYDAGTACAALDAGADAAPPTDAAPPDSAPQDSAPQDSAPPPDAADAGDAAPADATPD